MRAPQIRRILIAAAKTALAAFAAEQVAAQAPVPDFQTKVQPQDSSTPPEAEPEKPIDRERLLSELYQELKDADNAESAELVAEAIEKLWLQSGSDTVDLLMSRSIELVNAEDYDVALKLLDSVVTIAPNFAEGWSQRATVHFLKREYGESLQDLRHVLALEPRHFKAINGLGLIMQELGEKEKALKAFRSALKVHPWLEDAKQSVGELIRDVEGQGI
ncbi:MAG: tetratricopeptide repeat protein [Pseudomonadota bacterium]|nr:tetratricopeptide repeat protein [Pseudomonadota bacterium]